MKKRSLYLSLLAIATIFATSLTLNTVYANVNDTEYVTRGPLNGPDGENLYPGGGTGDSVYNTQYISIIRDPFNNWNTSIFNIGMGNPTMNNGVLSLPNYSRVVSSPLHLQNNTTYRITLGNLRNEVLASIIIPNEGSVLERYLNKNGSSVSFLYTHRDNRPIYLQLNGTGSPTLEYLIIEQQL